MVSRRSVKGNEGNWIEMQTDTFTNWTNANLKQRDMFIDDIETGFEDGVKLVNLFEVVAKRKVGRYAKNPKFPNQKLENVALVLRAMEQDGVKLISIDSDHIVNGNLKMILGMLWQLILRYQIGGTEDKSVKIALKKLLLIWLQHVIPEQQITNLTTNWNSGVALCNLVNVLKPGLCPEYNHLNRDTSVENCAKGMSIAEREFGIPEIISPEHMASHIVDELSMMTYLSYFTQDDGVGENWTKDLVNKWNPAHPISNFNTDWNDGRALGLLVETMAPNSVPDMKYDDNIVNCRVGMDVAHDRLGIPKIISAEEMANPNIPELAIMAYAVQFTKIVPREKEVVITKPKIDPAKQYSASGPGISDPQAGTVNEFYVRGKEGYSVDDLNVEVCGPSGRPIPVLFDVDDSELRTYRYNAEEPGNYSVSIKCGEEHIPKSPFAIHAKQDLNMIRVHGDGLSGGNVNEENIFTVDVGHANARVSAQINGPNGSNPASRVTNNSDGTYTIRYTPVASGTHKIKLSVNNEDLPGEPIKTHISDLTTVNVTSTQYEEDKQLYAELYERIGIAVDAQNSGDGTLTAQTVGPRDNEVPTDVEKEPEGNYAVSFTPTEIGEYHTNVYWNDKPIQGSPFIVWVSDPNRVIARGDVLKQSRVYEENKFEVSITGAGPGNLGSYAENEGRQLPVEVTKMSDDVYECVFQPDRVGEYLLHLNYNNVPIKGSPYLVKVGNPKEVTIVKTQTVVETTETYSLAVNLGEAAGAGNLESHVKGPGGDIVPSQIRQVSKLGKEIVFVPHHPGQYEVNIYYANTLLSGCPYYVNVSEARPRISVEATNVRVSGEGTTRGVVNDSSQVKVDAREAGPGHLSATVHGLKHDVIVGIRDHKDGTYSLSYTPPSAGGYTLVVKWDDEHVPGSPFKVDVQNRAVPESVVVEGEGIKEGTAGQPILFTLDGRKAGPGQLSCRCRAPSGKMTYVLISDNRDGTYTVDLNATEPGLHTVEVEWDGQPIPGSPFLVRIMQAPDVKKVRARGQGLESGTIGTFQGLFQVDSKGAGPGTLKVRIHGPKGAFKVEMFRDHPKERVINVRYNPTETGIYTANIFWSDEHVPGSPFEIYVADNDRELQRWKMNKEQVKREEGMFNGY